MRAHLGRLEAVGSDASTRRGGEGARGEGPRTGPAGLGDRRCLRMKALRSNLVHTLISVIGIPAEDPLEL